MTRSRIWFIFAILPLITVVFAASQVVRAHAGNSASAGPVVLTDEQGNYPLGLHMEILEDSSRKLTIDDVTSPDYSAKFIPSQAAVPNYGFTTSAYWVRLNIENQSIQPHDWLLDVGFPNMFYVDLYNPLPDGTGFAVKQSGVLRPPSTRDVFDPDVILKLAIPNQSRQTIYLRFETGGSMTLSLTLWKEDTFLKAALPSLWIVGLIYGALVGLLFYNAFLLISIRDSAYIYLVIFLACFLLWLGSYDGFTEIFLFRKYYYLKPYYFSLFFCLFWVAVILFGDALLELKARHHVFHRVMFFLLATWVVLVLLTPFLRYSTLAQLMLILALISLTVIMVSGFILWREHYLAIQFFMIAAFGFLAAAALTILVRFGILPSNFFTENGFRIGVVWLAVFWSITLANRINLMRAETENANRDLRKSEHTLSQILDGMPLGVVLYTRDHKPKYANQGSFEILTDQARDIRPDLSAGRTVADAIEYYSLKPIGGTEPYPLENFPAFSALHGLPAYVDDVEMHKGDRVVPLEVWASPIRNDSGEVESAVVVFQDISQRRMAEEILIDYRKHLEALVDERTTDLNNTNKELRLRLEWLAAVNYVNQMIAQSANFAEIHEAMLEIVKHLFSIQAAFIAEFNTDNQDLKILAHSSSSQTPALIDSAVPLSELIGSNPGIEPGKPVSILREEFNPFTGPLGDHLRVSEMQCLVFVPLQVREHVLGLLGMEMREEGRKLTPEEANLLTIFTTDIAQLIEDARLFEQAKLLAATEERNRLARELHDSVAQALYSISLFIDAARLALKTNKYNVAESHLQELTHLSREAMSNMRLLIFQLRPPILEKSGLVTALQSRLESVEAKAGFQTQFETEGEIHLTSVQESELYGIAQEALNNVLKHAQASQVTVRLTGLADSVQLTIEDNGIGFDPHTNHAGGQGLRNMRERAMNMGASFTAESAPGQGAKITIKVNE